MLMAVKKEKVISVRLIEPKSLWRSIMTIFGDAAAVLTVVTIASGFVVPEKAKSVFDTVFGWSEPLVEDVAAVEPPEKDSVLAGNVTGWTYLGNQDDESSWNYRLRNDDVLSSKVWKPTTSTNVRAEVISSANPSPKINGVASIRQERDHCFVQDEQVVNATTKSIWLRGSVVKCAIVDAAIQDRT